MAQFDDIIGSVMQKLEDMGEADNTIIVVTADNGTETFTWPDGGNTPFKGSKGMEKGVYFSSYRRPYCQLEYLLY